MADLEQAEAVVEPVEQVSVTEQAEQVSGKTEEVVSEEPKLTQADIEKAVTDRLKAAETDWQSRKDRELQPLKDKLEQQEKALTEHQLSVLEKKELEELGDTPETRKFHTDRRKFYDEKQSNDILVARAIQTNKTYNAREISAEYGVDKDALMAGDSPEAMRVIAKALAYEKLQEKKAEEAPSQEVDSGVPSTPGVDLSKLSPHELIAYGIRTQKKK